MQAQNRLGSMRFKTVCGRSIPERLRWSHGKKPSADSGLKCLRN